jgi:hypothetical protein
MISNSFLASATYLSTMSANPEMVLEAIKRTMGRALKLQHSKYVVKLFISLKNKKIGTSSVESLCKRTCRGLPNKRVRSMVQQVMMWRLKDAENQLRSDRYSNTIIWREVKSILITENIVNEYTVLWSLEKGRYEQELIDLCRSKVAFLYKKYSVTKCVPDVVRGIVIEDQHIPETFSSEPRCYGGVRLDDCEKKALELPPKFALYDSIDPVECEAQIEKGLAKLRWSLRKREREELGAVDVERTLYSGEDNSLDFREMRATDLPFNMRVCLPGALVDEKEIAMYSLKLKLKEVIKKVKVNSEGQHVVNLGVVERKGLASLKKKIASNELVVF